MSDALPLPPRPNLEQYKKLAKDLQRACKSSDLGAIQGWASRWLTTLASLHGGAMTSESQATIDVEAKRVEQRWRQFVKSNERAARCLLADAQFFVARGHGFASWPKFARHLESLAVANSTISQFEAAVDAIVAGDLPTLEKLLADDPKQVRARSTREHRSTLLHYVSANGVEDFRQMTPKNIVAIARLLLAAGADVNAESDAYAGRSTTLGLTATSFYPEDAGVQLALLELLIEHGAAIDGPDGGSGVLGCLYNGRGEAAEFLAARGARLDLEGAAGVGRLDLVESFFNSDGSLKSTATKQQMVDAFAWACQFGRTAIVEFLLARGVEVGAPLKHDGQTGLHWAALCGHADTVELLLEHGASVEAKDASYGGMPLGWALYGWGTCSPAQAQRGRFHETVARLAQAGATLTPGWQENDESLRPAARKLQSDARMQAALRGELRSDSQC